MTDIKKENTQREYLYHYTSIESLALILKNHTIRLNPLNKMDDLQEQRTYDIDNFGQFFFASSWTDDKEESIPMWKMYTDTSEGVRIRLRKNPFKRQGTKIEELNKIIKYMPIEFRFQGENPDTLLNMSKLIEQKIYSADACHGNILHQVIYTNEKELLEPQILTKTDQGYSFLYGILGRYKNEYWAFQKEWRYLMSFIPLDLSGTNEECIKKMLLTIQRIVKGIETFPIFFIDLEIEEEYFEEMEITPSPQMSTGYRILLDSLIEKYNPKANIIESELMGLI